tara:strand:- start:362 stop:541 length:180 start_codon:yes stop_codon:yes gene_type:complete
MKFLDKIKIGIHHAAYHRNMKKAQKAQNKRDLNEFKKYVYKAEDAWKKIVTLRKRYNNE